MIVLWLVLAGILTSGCRKLEPEPAEENSLSISYSPSVSMTSSSITYNLSPVGMELAQFGDATAEWLTIDQMVQARPWQAAACDATSVSVTTDAEGLTIDDDGWVSEFPTDGRCITTTLFQHAHGVYPSGTYLVKYTGIGMMEVAGDGVLTAISDGLANLTVATPTTAGVLLRISDLDSVDPLRNIQVIAPGGVCGRSAEELDPFAYCANARGGTGTCSEGFTCFDFGDVTINPHQNTTASGFVASVSTAQTMFFHPLFLQSVKAYRALGFKRWLTPDEASTEYAPAAVSAYIPEFIEDRGAPWAFAISLANLVQADPWITIPYFFTDLAARDMANAFALTLNTSLSPHISYTESFWLANTSRRAFLNAMANALDLASYEHYYVRRASEIAGIWRRSFSSTAERIHFIEPVNPEDVLMPARLQTAVRGTNPFTAISISMEFNVPQLVTYDTKGVSDLFNRLGGGGSVAESGSILGLKAKQASDMATAAKVLGLPLIASSSGPRFDDPHVLNDPRELARLDARIGTMILKNLKAWKDAGGTLILGNKSADDGDETIPWGSIKFQQADTSGTAQALPTFIQQYACWWAKCDKSAVSGF